MAGNFTPLRRKFGVLTLVMACVMMGLWLRSLWIYDSLIVWTSVDTADRAPRGVTIEVKTIPHSFAFFKRREGDEKHSVKEMNEHFSRLWLRWGTRFVEPKYITQVLRMWPARSYGFAIGEYHDPDSWQFNRHQVLVLPYWPIVIPLTILSAWLLLSKPRAKLSNGS